MASWAEMKWLTGQVRSHAPGHTFIQSFTDREQSYVYDQALAIIAFTRDGDYQQARALIKTLEKFQLEDGTWYFSYYFDGRSPHPEEGDMRPHGAVAWAAMALLTYEKESGDRSFRKVWYKTLEHLERNIVEVPRLEKRALRFAAVDNKKTAWNEREVVALEHALDGIAAFRMAHHLTKEKRWKTHQKHLEDFALALWDEAEGHFWSGASVATGKINRGEFYLDNQSWSALALSHLPLKDKLRSALMASCRLEIERGPLKGFSESRSPASEQNFIWSEGTAGKALALELQQVSCAKTAPRRYIATLESMKHQGGVRYVDSPDVVDFSHAPSVAGTVWTWFLRHKINPFDL